MALVVWGTPTPPPGPGCVGNKVPIANQSGLEPDCPAALEPHNASCAKQHKYTSDPQFHPMDSCFGENDPNGPFYFNGVYHLMYQDHVVGGIVGGHIASDDLITWRQLEVALWNDKWYDKGSVYTFSATIVDGVPTMASPGATKGCFNERVSRSSVSSHAFTVRALEER